MNLNILYTSTNRFVNRFVYSILPLVMLCSFADGQLNVNREYQVKAGFLYNFTQFVEWPASSFENAKSPFIIGIVGEDPFGNILNQTVDSETVAGHSIQVQRFTSLKEAEHCHLLFINIKPGVTEEEKLGNIRPGILTVGEAPDFIEAGGMIRLETRDNKVKIIINPAAVKAAELNISSKLLNVAEIAETPKT